MECFICFEIIAPKGLLGIESKLKNSSLNLYTWVSGYNGKTIIRNSLNGSIDLSMDSSDTDTLNGSGVIEADYSKAIKLMEELSSILESCNYSHEIGIDKDDKSESYDITYTAR